MQLQTFQGKKTNLCCTPTRVKAVDGDARVLEPLGQLDAVQHVGKLGLRVGLPLVVALLPVDVVKVHLSALVRQAGHDDDAAKRIISESPSS